MNQEAKLSPFLNSNRFRALSPESREGIVRFCSIYPFTHQEIRRIIETAVDFEMWDAGNLPHLWDPIALEQEFQQELLKGGQRKSGIAPPPPVQARELKKRLLGELEKRRNRLISGEKEYDSFTPPEAGEVSVKEVLVDHIHSGPILGRCPVAGEKTRCCNLETLDAVKQCGYGCSYCSIQSFYDQGRIYFADNLEQKLKELGEELKKRREAAGYLLNIPPGSGRATHEEPPGLLPPEKLPPPQLLRHIGTGQSSDSLMWGNRRGLLEKLTSFAAANPEVILELKTKSGNSRWLEEHPLPFNLLATWSLNPETIIRNEEHLTASLEERLTAARRCADKGIALGFHFHPMVHYKGWEEEYGALFQEIQHRFSPQEVVCISLGTLTFIKPVIKQLKERKLRSKILQMPMEEIAGKQSYPLEIKKELFSFAYSSFSQIWRDDVFFYLCMEDIRLWEPLFGRSYGDNDAFERDMKESYYRKLVSIKEKTIKKREKSIR